jgi:hypothetical protein
VQVGGAGGREEARPTLARGREGPRRVRERRPLVRRGGLAPLEQWGPARRLARGRGCGRQDGRRPPVRRARGVRGFRVGAGGGRRGGRGRGGRAGRGRRPGVGALGARAGRGGRGSSSSSRGSRRRRVVVRLAGRGRVGPAAAAFPPVVCVKKEKERRGWLSALVAPRARIDSPTARLREPRSPAKNSRTLRLGGPPTPPRVWPSVFLTRLAGLGGRPASQARARSGPSQTRFFCLSPYPRRQLSLFSVYLLFFFHAVNSPVPRKELDGAEVRHVRLRDLYRGAGVGMRVREGVCER